MTIGKVVARIRNTLREFHPDTRLSNRHSWNIAYTASLLILDQEKDKIYNLDIFKPVTLVAEEVDIYADTCVPLSCIKCRYKLPESFVEGKLGLKYKYIATPDKSVMFHNTSPQLFQNKSKIKGNSQKYSYIENGYLYTNECHPCISISILTEDGITGDKCNVLQQKAPIPDRILQKVFQMEFNELFNSIKIPFNHTDNKNLNN